MLLAVRALAFLALSFLIGSGPGTSCAELYDLEPEQKSHLFFFDRVLSKTAKTHFSRYVLWIGAPLHLIQPALWVYLLEFLDGKSLWEMSLTCKWFGSIIRNPRLQLFRAWCDKSVLTHIVMDSEIALPDCLWRLIEPYVNIYLPPIRTDRLQSKTTAELQARTRFVNFMAKKRMGPFIARTVVQGAKTITDSHFFLLLERQHLYVRQVRGQDPKYHYLYPSIPGTRIFDRVSAGTMNLLMASGSKGQHQMFALSILADYVIPFLHGNLTIGKKDRKVLHDVYPLLRSGLTDVANLILWAVYLCKGAARYNFKKLTAELKHLRILWPEIRLECHSVEFFQEMEARGNVPDMRSLLLIAMYFGIGYKLLASQTQTISRLSRRITKGEIPLYLDSSVKPTSIGLYQVVYGEIPLQYQVIVSPIQPVIQTTVLPDASESSYYWATNYVEQRPMKRQRLDGPPQISPPVHGYYRTAYQDQHVHQPPQAVAAPRRHPSMSYVQQQSGPFVQQHVPVAHYYVPMIPAQYREAFHQPLTNQQYTLLIPHYVPMVEQQDPRYSGQASLCSSTAVVEEPVEEFCQPFQEQYDTELDAKQDIEHWENISNENDNEVVAVLAEPSFEGDFLDLGELLPAEEIQQETQQPLDTPYWSPEFQEEFNDPVQPFQTDQDFGQVNYHQPEYIQPPYDNWTYHGSSYH